jgi:hypothetical protein
MIGLTIKSNVSINQSCEHVKRTSSCFETSSNTTFPRTHIHLHSFMYYKIEKDILRSGSPDLEIQVHPNERPRISRVTEKTHFSSPARDDSLGSAAICSSYLDM